MILYFLFGVLLILLATPLVLGLVPPNPWYGIRLPSYAAKDKWYPLNRRGGLIVLLLGGGFLLTGILLTWFVPPVSNETQVLLTVLPIPIFVLVVIVTLIIAPRIDL